MLAFKSLGAWTAAEKTYVEDVFSTYLYTGTSATQTITNGIDLAGKGGLVWTKSRGVADNHYLIDSARFPNEIYSNATNAQADGGRISSLNSNGYTLSSNAALNQNTNNYVSWTFRKAPKFFDVVTYTGNGVNNRQIAHNLTSTPGIVIIKRTDSSTNWVVRQIAGALSFILNSDAQQGTDAGNGYVVDANSSTFTVAGVFNQNNVNALGGTYVAYLFAHDTSADGLIQCGSYTGNGSATGPVVTLGWEPQWLMIKNASGTGNWQIVDNIRGMPVGSADATLQANLSNAESAVEYVSPTATGFQITSTSSEVNTNASTYIYMAVRRPMKTPTSGAEVFNPVVYTGTNVDNRLVNTGIVTDLVWVRQRNDTVIDGMIEGDRLRGNPYLLTGSAGVEVNDANSLMTPTSGYGNSFSAMNGFGVGNDATSKLNVNTTSNNHVALAFKRASQFFDVITYKGVGSGVAIPHNLGVAPQMIIAKNRNRNGYGAAVWTAYTGNTGANLSGNGIFSSIAMSPTVTATSITYGSVGYEFNFGAADNYVSYLFASCPGVSKVGGYTGNGTSQTINCGFTTGARFVLIKRTDTTGDWYVWNTATGITASTDPHLSLNSTAAEVTTDDSVDPDAFGFIVNQDAATNINVSSATYIYLAIA